MTTSTPSRGRASSLTKECEAFFFNSSALAHLDRPSILSRSRRHSMSHNVRGNTRDRRSIHSETARSARRAADGDLEPLSCQGMEYCQRTLPMEMKRIAINSGERVPDNTKSRDANFLHNTAHQANSPVAPHQTSFSQNNVGTIKKRTRNCNSLRKESCTTGRTAAKGSTSTCDSYAKTISESKSGPSISSLVNWPPPPPPRISSQDLNSKTMSLSSMFESTQKIELPFSAAMISSSSPPSHPTRKNSILKQDQINRQRQHNCNATKLPTAVSSPPRFPQKRRSRNDHPGTPADKQYFHHQRNAELHHGFRKDYTLGETARSPSHMIIESCPQKAAKNVSQLKNYDFAFIKRTDGSWTYSILASRSCVGGLELSESPEECMLFVMSDGGSTKLIKRRQWVDFIRLVAVEEDFADGVETATCKAIATEFQRQLKLEDDWVPECISIEMGGDDSSSVSFASF
ncbi:hypothetical protein HJC23_005993 [Cyclotella cryptica]|uniref:Uncharacterized protein n=1 Tax=Cyclotella cryptica TaxID=29204 RepID=A0ABD3NX09_9STRA